MAVMPHHPDALPLAPTLAALSEEPRRTLDRLHEMQLRYVQISAMQPGLRPRELDKSARRDLLATLRRLEIELVGIDLWIPSGHFSDPAHTDRAVNATISAIDLAADLGRVPVSLLLPVDEARSVIVQHAHRLGVPLADHAIPPSDAAGKDELLGIGIDPAAWLAAGDDPAAALPGIGGRLLAARLCDLSTAGMRMPIGNNDGRLNVDAYRVGLSIAGYRRPVIVDARQWPQPWEGIEQTMRAWALR